MVSVQVTVSGCHGIYPEMTSSSANNPFQLETDLVEETVEEIVVVKEVIDFYEEEETESFVEVAFWYEIAPCGRGQETSRNDGPSFSRRLQLKVPAQETSKIDDLPSWKLLRPEKSVF